MYKVYKFKYIGDYGGGMGIVAAKTEEEAKEFIKKWSPDFHEEYTVSEELIHLVSDKEGIICYQFYIE